MQKDQEKVIKKWQRTQIDTSQNKMQEWLTDTGDQKAHCL